MGPSLTLPGPALEPLDGRRRQVPERAEVAVSVRAAARVEIAEAEMAASALAARSRTLYSRESALKEEVHRSFFYEFHSEHSLKD